MLAAVMPLAGLYLFLSHAVAVKWLQQLLVGVIFILTATVLGTKTIQEDYGPSPAMQLIIFVSTFHSPLLFDLQV